MANEEQARYWTEEGGPRWVEEEQAHDLMLRELGEALLRALAPQPGERVLDLGCGYGTTTLAVADAVGPSGWVLGVDIAAPMIARARARADAAGLRHVELRVADVQAGDLGGPHDAAVSRFGVMFFADPEVAMANVGAAVRTGGRAAFIVWRGPDDNPWYSLAQQLMLAALPEPPPPGAPLAPGPFGWADADLTADVMTRAGWEAVSSVPFDAEVVLGGTRGVDGALDHARSTFTGRLLAAQLDAQRADQVLGEVRDLFTAHERDGQVRFPAGAWIVRARRP